MLRFLFPRLTPAEPRGTKLFEAVVAESRKRHWYAELGVPDNLDGRFSVLATVTALATLRLERGGDTAQQASVALAERFIESMDHEHRQLGYGDPTIGKIVRRLVGSLARRVERFRPLTTAEGDWTDAAKTSLKGIDAADASRQSDAGTALHELWRRLEECPDNALVQGKWA